MNLARNNLAKFDQFLLKNIISTRHITEPIVELNQINKSNKVTFRLSFSSSPIDIEERAFKIRHNKTEQ